MYDVRKHGGLFASVEDYDKAQEFVHLIRELTSDIEFEVRPWVVIASAWAYPKGRPGYAQAYFDLGSKLGYLARLMAWPTSKYPLEVIPCAGSC